MRLARGDGAVAARSSPDFSGRCIRPSIPSRIFASIWRSCSCARRFRAARLLAPDGSGWWRSYSAALRSSPSPARRPCPASARCRPPSSRRTSTDARLSAAAPQSALRQSRARKGPVADRTMRPDVITLNEVSAMWAEKLALLSAAYPIASSAASTTAAGGVAILSRRPFAEAPRPNATTAAPSRSQPSISAARPVEVATLHLHWPWPYDQSWQIDMSRRYWPRGRHGHLAGDMNATPWSAAVARVAEPARPDAGRPCRADLALPPAARVPALGRPADRPDISKGDVEVNSVQHAGRIGSDHGPCSSNSR